jgi:hypothetical protein
MTFDWHEYLLLARFLAKLVANESGLDREAVHRAAISRAYYAAFGHASAYARNWLGFRQSRIEDRTQDNGRIPAFLRGKRRARAANYLRRLRDLRNKSDYDSESNQRYFEDGITEALEASESVFLALPPPAPPPEAAP